jgi:hypothetical protein
LADERPLSDGKQLPSVKELMAELCAPSYVQRKQAFLRLCDPALDIDQWIQSPESKNDPQLASALLWIGRIRSLPGSVDERLDAVSDFSALGQGSGEVIERYAKEGKLDLLLEMVRLIPKGSRDLILQSSFTQGENSLDHVFDKAWEIQRPELIPKFLDVLLPVHPVRIGLNRRWSMLGLGEAWKLQVPLDTSAMQLAALESEGQIDQAVQLARQMSEPAAIEKLLLRNYRWDGWLDLDPSRLSLISAAWSELPRVLILKALDRGQEAQEFYELRKKSAAKGTEQQLLLTHLAMLTGDAQTLFDNLKENAPDQLTGIYFLHNRIDELLESEGLQERTEATVTSWLDRNVVEGKGFSKPTRFQALFRRLGETNWSELVQARILQLIDSNPRDRQLQLWKDYLQQAMRYGLDEKRAELIATALKKLEVDTKSDRRLSNRIAGFPEAQTEREMTNDDLFRESFPYMKEAAYPLYRAIKLTRPGRSDRESLEWLVQMHQGIKPEAWTQADISKVFQEAVTIKMLDGGSPNGILIDLAESLDAMGAREDAIAFLENIRGVNRADLMRSRLLFITGDYQQARQVAMQTLERGSGDLETFQWNSELFDELRDQSTLKMLEQRMLARPSGMEDFAKYSQEMRRSERFELAEPIARFLELQYDSFPSSLASLWLEDIYWSWNLMLLANHYHQTVPDRPERADRNFDLTLASCLFDIFTEFDSPSGINMRMARGRTSIGWDLDWSQWAWRYERVLAGGFWQAVRRGERAKADRFLRAAHRLNPEQINTLIDAVPWVLDKFDRETLKEWFLVYYEPMAEHLKKYPRDTLIANNAAWLAAKCGFEFDQALEFSRMVVNRQPSDTYLDTLAEVHFVRGDIDKAIELSLECQRLNPRDPHLRRQLQRYNESR